ncbi:Fusaric acid resistance protein-like [Rubrobacter radiotolerans]|uniref:FUSC family protein n=1 Tax=Rubrobacter radiotolerans TaxID=42256 RepID=A0A023X3C6_RUBRA|nr:FUSC family protein [Rubrobacter radiotolerans]AHY46977.1 Fusaric acid resistance protein-like [Rubrobacter radiotolerans]MDX5894383.1 FUSC family protein [Rubrobacter radiotolerans]SMC05874.1 Uncharacterized membrane protein YgaE, UPF0421/DUF939 family [Rubrobacter radiotolerans DSM 5868]
MAIAGVLAQAKREGIAVTKRRAELARIRLRAGMWPVIQTAAAAALAWSAASVLLGHERPFVAAIAAVISVGAVAGQTLRRAAEWILGVAVGLAVADLIMLAIGTGPVQTGVMVGLAMTAALVIRSGIMFVTEAGVSAILVAGLDPTTHGVSPDRFLEGLLGGGVALAVAATFPSNPSLRVQKAARPALEDLAGALRESAVALIAGDRRLAGEALYKARHLDESVARLREELDGGYQIARYSPARRRHLGNLGPYSAVAEGLDLASRNTRVLARAVVSLVHERGDVPERLPEAILELALAVEAFGSGLEQPRRVSGDVRCFALGAASEATRSLETRSDLETSVLVGQVRSTALDLLQAAGMDPTEATETLRRHAGRTGPCTGSPESRERVA